MKKLFILTGEPSGDKLASTVISKLKKNNSDIKYSCVGGQHLNSLGIKSIYHLKEITYIGFTSVLLNIFKIKKKINETVNSIIEFNPDILFSVDKSLEAKNKDIIIAAINGEFTVKRYVLDNNCIYLRSENKSLNYPNIKIFGEIISTWLFK